MTGRWLQGALSVLLVLLAWACLATLLAVLAKGLFLVFFGFDAWSMVAWTGLAVAYGAGQTIPFGFALLSCGLAVPAMVAMLLLAGCHARLPGAKVLAEVILAMVAGLSGIGRMTWRVLGLLRAFGRWRRRDRIKPPEPDLVSRPAAVSDAVKAAPGRTADNEACEHFAQRDRCPRLSTPKSGETTPRPLPQMTGAKACPTAIAPPQAPVGAVEHGGAEEEASAEAEDSGALCRALTLAEVWSEPPAPWMIEALGEELARFTPAAWARLDALGAPPGGLGDIAVRYGWRRIPQPETSSADPSASEAFQPEPRTSVDPAAAPSRDPPAPQRDLPRVGLTMTAAWLCESLDNHLLCQQAAPSGMAAPAGQDWDAAAALAASQLTAAMRAMTATDWQSLDRFPEQAGRVRVLTDRFGDSRREAAAAERDAAIAAVQPDPADPSDTLAGRLAGAGWELSGHPAGRDVLARRGPVRLLARLVDLGEGGWTMPGGMLDPWVAADGRRVASPCRDLWQDMAMLRALDAGQAPARGVVVIGRGRFADEAGTVRAVSSGRQRSGVDLVYLDAPGSGLPGLAAWLDAIDRGAAEDAFALALQPQR